MSNYVTTNIRLPEEDYLRLKEEAAKNRKSLSAVIREKISGKKPIKDFAKMLLELNTDWFTEEDFKTYKKSRRQLKKRVKLYDW
ncbi:ribbon-helix-helix protein, CopG family [Candidatus Daviesbacteria bacterium]|nr:ribbon-helix-helix protein, CopG family [Candidatus Daviesbacteria bacterium]